MSQTGRYRLRITFAKEEALKYISHLDLARTWERALRRARVPLAYSGGFNPRPKMAFAAALPVGYTSVAEMLDVFLEDRLTPAEMARRLADALPAGLRVIAVAEVEPRLPALQSQVRAAEYSVRVAWPGDGAELEARIAALLAETDLPCERMRKGRRYTYNLRPLIEVLRVEAGEGADYRLWMKLRYGSEGTGRPEDVLSALGLADALVNIQRIALCV